MIDRDTGEIRFPGWSHSVSQETTRDVFVRSSLAHDAAIQVKNERYCSWRLKPVQGDDGKWWTTILSFEGDRLSQVILAASDHETSQWDDWSEELEMRKAEYHSDVLQKILGNVRQFPWGSVEANYDGKSGSSSIVIKYE